MYVAFLELNAIEIDTYFMQESLCHRNKLTHRYLIFSTEVHCGEILY